MKAKLLLLSISLFGLNLCYSQNFQADSIGWELQIESFRIQLENEGLDEAQINQRLEDFEKKREDYFQKKDAAFKEQKSKKSKTKIKEKSQNKWHRDPIDKEIINANYSNILEKKLIFLNSSKQQEILYKINESRELIVTIEGSVDSGTIQVQLIDDNSKLHGEIEIEKNSHGLFYKKIINPSNGTWRIIFMPQSAEGEISVILARKP